MNKLLCLLMLGCILVAGCEPPRNVEVKAPAAATLPTIGMLEVVAELSHNPGNITVTKDNRIFVSLHQFRNCPARLVEVTGKDQITPWPNAQWNAEPGSGPDVMNAVLGVQLDAQGKWLWALDNGQCNPAQPPKLLAFDVATGALAYRHNFPTEVAPAGTFLNDLAVDSDRGFVYIADIGGILKSALVIVDVNKQESWRFTGHPALEAEAIDMVIAGHTMMTKDLDGKPHTARIGVNPITLSPDCETLYFGAMSSTNWWSVPTELLRSKQEFATIAAAIKKAGPKTISDGASTDAEGNHYFTAVCDNSIFTLTTQGELKRLVRDERISWPDAISFGADSWLYFVANQLHLSPPLNDGVEGGKPPYLIMRVWTGTKGIPGR